MHSKTLQRAVLVRPSTSTTMSPFATINVSSAKPIVIVNLDIGSRSTASKAMFHRRGPSTDHSGTPHDNPSVMGEPPAHHDTRTGFDSRGTSVEYI